MARSVQGGREARAWRVQRDVPELADKMKAAAEQLDAQAAASEGEDAEKSRALADTLCQGVTGRFIKAVYAFDCDMTRDASARSRECWRVL